VFCSTVQANGGTVHANLCWTASTIPSSDRDRGCSIIMQDATLGTCLSRRSALALKDKWRVVCGRDEANHCVWRWVESRLLHSRTDACTCVRSEESKTSQHLRPLTKSHSLRLDVSPLGRVGADSGMICTMAPSHSVHQEQSPIVLIPVPHRHLTDGVVLAPSPVATIAPRFGGAFKRVPRASTTRDTQDHDATMPGSKRQRLNDANQCDSLWQRSQSCIAIPTPVIPSRSAIAMRHTHSRLMSNMMSACVQYPVTACPYDAQAERAAVLNEPNRYPHAMQLHPSKGVDAVASSAFMMVSNHDNTQRSTPEPSLELIQKANALLAPHLFDVP